VYEVTTTSAPSIASGSSWPRLRSVSVTVTTRSPGLNAPPPPPSSGRRCRRDDQERISGGLDLARVADEAKRLHRLAQPHVVGEHPTEPVRQRKHSQSTPSRW
jgi:hypothetical protein